MIEFQLTADDRPRCFRCDSLCFVVRRPVPMDDTSGLDLNEVWCSAGCGMYTAQWSSWEDHAEMQWT